MNRPRIAPQAAVLVAMLALQTLSAQPRAAPECEISFDSAVLDVCTGEVTVFTEVLGELATVQPASGELVVKFPAPATPEQQQALTGIGTVRAYFPWYAYLLDLDGEPPGELPPGALWMGGQVPLWKIDINLLRHLEAGSSESLRLLVETRDPGQGGDLTDLLLAFPSATLAFVMPHIEGGGDRVAVDIGAADAEAALALLAPLTMVANITALTPVAWFSSQGPWLHQSGTPGMTPLFDRGLFGCGESLGILDSGLDFGHCSFRDDGYGAPNLATCDQGALCPPIPAIHPGPMHRKLAAYYKWDAAADPLGDGVCGHGTRVASVALGNDLADLTQCPVPGSNGHSGGIGNTDGMAPGARLVFQQGGSGQGSYWSLGGNLEHAVSIAYTNFARVHSNSWGYPCNPCNPSCVLTYSSTSRQADERTWTHPDLVIVAAAGNLGVSCGDGNNVVRPANAKNAIAVGATERGTQADHIRSTSSRGPTEDRRTKPDLVAQGGNIVAASSNGDPFLPGCATCSSSGTSLAAPAVAGLAVLVRDYFRSGFHPSGRRTPADAWPVVPGALVKAVLVNAGRWVSGSGGGPGPNQNQGWGRVTLDDALYFEGDTRRLWVHSEGVGLVSGQADTFTLVVGASQPLKATLVWYDFPATVGANPHIVNQLRLEARPPGPVSLPWSQKLDNHGVPDPNPYQDVGALHPDLRNTVHQLQFAAPQPGVWTFSVFGVNVAMGGTQPYALVVSGDLPVLIFRSGFE
jgi:hypothetical protein